LHLLRYPGGKDEKSYTVPFDVMTIGDKAFQRCGFLTSITIPSGVTAIGDYAFYSCKALTSIIIPSGVKTIGFHAFGSCGSLTSIKLPKRFDHKLRTLALDKVQLQIEPY
jgi:hypothetical protein